MDVDGANLKNISNTPDVDEWAPTWSPDGSQFIYDYTPVSSGEGEIWVMEADGTNPRPLAQGIGNETGPAVSADGSKIVHTTNWGGDVEIVVMDSDGSNSRQRTNNSSVDSGPSFNLDSTRIIFFSDRSGNREIYAMDLNGSNVTNLTNDPSEDFDAEWVPRKRGFVISEDSLLIPTAVSESLKSTQEITAEITPSVVRIETDLGSGSGAIIDSTGFILTNNHVVLGASELTVHLQDGTTFDGSIQGRDLSFGIWL